MIAIRRQCLEPYELRQVIDGSLDKDQFDSAISHLDHCVNCRTAAESLADVPPVLPVDDSVDPPSQNLQNETACQIALQNLLHGTPAPTASPSSQSVPLESLGPYRIKELIGSGGMGAVYLAEHQRLKRQCAIKLLPPERVTQAGWLERFDREMTTIASLQHPHIVHATDAGHESGWHYLVMEHLDGLDIGRIASRMGQLDVADACEIIRQAALGLAHIHDSGLVHRDIKPSNLMLTRSGTVKLLDLGLVLDGDDPLSKDDRLTTVGHVMGTMPYMAPEQLADSRDVRPQSDIYSLGATFYRLIAGHPPHRAGRGLAAQVLAITSQDATPLDAIREDVDREIVTLVSKMLSRDPEKRPAAAAEIARQLALAAKPQRLQRLVRDAMRKQGADDLVRSGWLPTLSTQSTGDRRWSKGHVMLGIAAAGLLMLAAVVFKIQTDRGDLIVHSDQDDLSIVIKQGDTVVEKLMVNSGADNRTTLRKGTYQVEIQGGNAIQLSENVVTIGRGTNHSIDVIPLSDETTEGPDMATTRLPGLGNLVPSDTAESSDQQVPPVKTGFEDYLSTESGITETGIVVPMKQHPEWVSGSLSSFSSGSPNHLESIRSEQNVEALCESAFAAMALIQDYKTRGIPYDTNLQLIIDALFERSRVLGGTHSSLPPLPGIQNQPITDSEHFMRCLTQVFAELDPVVWWNSAIDELVDGNVHSRSAAIYCLFQDVREGGMGNVGLTSAMYSYPNNVPDDKNKLAKFSVSKLMRCCIGLSATDVWSGLESHQSERAASMAREVAIMILQNNTFALSNDFYEKLQSVILALPAPQRSDFERNFLPESARQRQLETVFDEISVAPSVTVAAASDPLTPLANASSPTLYQGRDLDNWMDALDRERDVQTLGETMKAVEMLTRESDDSTRHEAARRTMFTARRLGGIVSAANDSVPSHQFMTLFPSIFASYLPDIGVDVIAQEFVDGNRRSQSASLWVLQDFLNGIDHQGSSRRSRQSAASWVIGILENEHGREKLSLLREKTLDVADTIEGLPSAEEEFPNEYRSIAMMARSVALRLNALMAAPVDEDLRMKEFVINQVASVQSMIDAQPATPGLSNEPVRLDDFILAAAAQLAERDPEFGSDPCWDFLLMNIASAPKMGRLIYSVPKLSDDKLTAFAIFKRAVPDRLLATIHQTLQDPSEIIARTDWFVTTIPWYAANYPDIDDASAALTGFRLNLAATGRPESLESVVDDGLKAIGQRKDAQITPAD